MDGVAASRCAEKWSTRCVSDCINVRSRPRPSCPVTSPYSAAMTADPTVLDRIFDRLVRTLSASGPDQLRAPFTVAEIVQSLVPYRTYRNELGVDTLQDYEHAVLEMLAGERGWLVCDPDTVTVIKKELGSPDPDTGLLRRLQTVEVRMGAIRMPIDGELRAPIARESEDAPDEAAKRSAAKVDTKSLTPDANNAAKSSTANKNAAKRNSGAVERIRKAAVQGETAVGTKVPDAIAIGAVMDREDAALARAEAGLPSVADIATVVSADVPPLPTTLHAANGVTIASAQTLARITPLSVPSVYGDPIEFRGVRHAPVDVGGVIFLFGMVARELGFNVEAMSSGFPRCEAKRQVSAGKWARLRIDFELESRQFRDAGRNPAACDLIVCWRDTWPDRPATLDVLSLERMLPTLGSQS